MTPTLLAGLTGVMQGARHALEPDHVTAVATVMVEAPSPRRGIFYAACWGLGHASMLLFVAGPLVLLRVELPGLLTTLLELAVGAMLIFLGVRTLRDPHSHGHTHGHKGHGGHGGRESGHAPATGGSKASAAPWGRNEILYRGRRPFVIGVVHGLAGSGALAALIALSTPTVATGLACLTLYAFGTIVGMVGLAAFAGPVLSRAGRFPQIAPAITKVAGIVSIVVGIVWAARTLAEI